MKLSSRSHGTARRLSRWVALCMVPGLLVVACSSNGNSSADTTSTTASSAASASSGSSAAETSGGEQASSTAASSSGSAAGSDSGTAGPSSPAGGGTASFVVPQQVGAPPYSFVDDSGQLAGLLPDLSVVVGDILGTPTKNVQATFENSLLGLQRGIYATVPGADVTAERLKTFDFATSVRDGYGFEVPVGKPAIPDSMDGLCGLTITVVAGSSPIPALQAQSKACQDAGKKPISIKTFTDWATAALTVKSGQADATTQTLSTMGYQNRTTPNVWTQTGPKYNYVDIGFATRKGDGMAQKICDATNKAIANGDYAKILDKYGIQSMAITECVINPTPKS